MKNQEKVSSLVSLLGEDNVENLRKEITSWLIQTVKDDVENYSEYLLYPPDVQDLIIDAIESSENKLKKLYKDTIFDVHKQILDEMKTYLLDRHDSAEKKLIRGLLDLIAEYKQKNVRYITYDLNGFSKSHYVADDLMRLIKDVKPDFVNDNEETIDRKAVE